MKKIYIDGLGLVEGHFSGVGQYILGIVRGLDEIIDEAKYHGDCVPDIYVIIPHDTVERFKSFKFKHIGYKKFPLSFRIMSSLWYRGKVPPLDLLYGRGIYIFPRFVGMNLLFSKSTLVIIDLSYELHSQYSDDRNARFLSKQVRRSLKRTRKVIVISKSVKREVVKFYGLNSSDVSVATPAADPKLFYRRSQEEIKRAKLKYGISGDYILALSNLEPRKNLITLVDAYCRLPKSVTKDTALLLVGVNGWKTEGLFSHIIDKVQEGYKIIRPSQYVSDEDKQAIISGAKMLVYPSHYEGFGIPPLEALACGVPVITADNSSLPEVVGKVGVMVPSTDIDLLSNSIKSYLDDYDALARRMAIEGPQRAAMFSWAKSAQVFLDVVKELDR
ncbi:MAG TPA: glycosyltransferase family 1 protein [Candidatus Saccharimonadales bacterium]|nr:glycosyltransferase family 1 protein [Candidatus Saccharimonadales bacterium]